MGIPDGGPNDFGALDFLEPLELYLDALAGEAELTVVGRWMTRQFLVRLRDNVLVAGLEANDAQRNRAPAGALLRHAEHLAGARHSGFYQ
jgi:hypothetical protein